ncbi:unnamed protein product [Rangifer tarandus platyrhynchus]|uniref:Uncharacterized protein n=1 Tax=Rangifer tarandus platyrhynchus TaxID=3082113 RepID=A0AC59ZRN2_RANTA
MGVHFHSGGNQAGSEGPFFDQDLNLGLSLPAHYCFQSHSPRVCTGGLYTLPWRIHHSMSNAVTIRILAECPLPARHQLWGIGARALVKTGQTLLSRGSQSGLERHCKNKIKQWSVL